MELTKDRERCGTSKNKKGRERAKIMLVDRWWCPTVLLLFLI
jgi:hypothetical protein